MPEQDCAIKAKNIAHDVGVPDFNQLPNTTKTAAIGIAERLIEAKRAQNEGLAQEIQGDLEALFAPHVPSEHSMSTLRAKH